MTYYAVMGTGEVMWLGAAGNPREAVRLHMDDVGVDSYSQPRVYAVQEPPEGWEQASPISWLVYWVNATGALCLGVGDQVRVDGTIYDWSVVINLMDREILEAMAEAGIRCEPLTADDFKVISLEEFVRVYRELHADRFGGEVFRVG